MTTMHKHLATEMADQLAAANRIIAEQAEVIAKMHRALRTIIEANNDFRSSLPHDWDGDPVNDACEDARAALALVEQRK